MKKIAIRGNSLRGGEILSLLESLGGVNKRELNAYSENLYYYVLGNEIVPNWIESVPKEYKKLTIDEAKAEINKSMETKVCTKCGKELPVSEFHKNKYSKDGLQYMCKACNAKSVKESRQRAKAKIEKPVQPTVEPQVKEPEHVMHKVYTDPVLAKYSPRDLMLELKARGYEGELLYVEVIRKEHRISLGKLN